MIFLLDNEKSHPFRGTHPPATPTTLKNGHSGISLVPHARLHMCPSGGGNTIMAVVPHNWRVQSTIQSVLRHWKAQLRPFIYCAYICLDMYIVPQDVTCAQHRQNNHLSSSKVQSSWIGLLACNPQVFALWRCKAIYWTTRAGKAGCCWILAAICT